MGTKAVLVGGRLLERGYYSAGSLTHYVKTGASAKTRLIDMGSKAVLVGGRLLEIGYYSAGSLTHYVKTGASAKTRLIDMGSKAVLVGGRLLEIGYYGDEPRRGAVTTVLYQAQSILHRRFGADFVPVGGRYPIFTLSHAPQTESLIRHADFERLSTKEFVYGEGTRIYGDVTSSAFYYSTKM